MIPLVIKLKKKKNILLTSFSLFVKHFFVDWLGISNALIEEKTYSIFIPIELEE